MFGLMVLGAAALYLVLMFVGVRWAWRKGRVGGGSLLKASAFAVIAFLVVYLPVLWQLLPTMLLHRHYCQKDSGFSARVPAEQWLTANEAQVRAVRALLSTQREAISKDTMLPDGFSRSIHFDGLLASDFKSEKLDAWGGAVSRLTWRTADAASGEVLAVAIDYRSGYGDLRSWLNAESCVSRPPVAVGEPVKRVMPLDYKQVYDRILQGEKL